MLELRGAFVNHANRRRQDAKGNGPFNKMPPAALQKEAVGAWHEIVERLPLIALYDCDEFAVEIAARLLTLARLSGDLKVIAELRQWLGRLGMTPQDRTRLSVKEPEAPKSKAEKYLD